MSKAKTNQNLKQDIPPIYSREWQERIAERAKRIGYIHLGNFELLLALDKDYTPYLSRMYTDFKGSKSLGDSPDFSIFGNRVAFWNYFLAAMAPSTSELPWYKDHGGSPIPFPPLYLFNAQTKEYETRTGLDRVRAGSDAFVNLEDLKHFLENLQLPLLSLLYSSEEKPSQSTLPVSSPQTDKPRAQKKLRPSQAARKATERIAQSLWEAEDNSITKSNMAVRPEIEAVARDFSIRTRIKWLTGVNRKPVSGRRATTKDQ